MRVPWRWPTRNGMPPVTLVVGILVLAGLLTLSAYVLKLHPWQMLASIPKVLEYIGKLWTPPDWNYLPSLQKSLVETVEIAFLGTMLAGILSLPLGVLAGINSSLHPWLAYVVRGVLSLVRALPELVWAMIFVSAFTFGPFPGLLAITVVSVGLLGRFYADSLEVVDSRAVEGVQAQGASWLQTRLLGYLPQAVPDFVGSLLYLLDHNVRAATLLGIVGAGGVGYDLMDSITHLQYDRVFMILVSLFCLVLLIEFGSERLRRWVT